jgi:hypothetical protein
MGIATLHAEAEARASARAAINQLLPRPDPGMQSSFEETAGTPTGYVLAVDLGQARDWSAVVVNERVEADRIEYQRSKFGPVPKEARRRPMIRHNLVRLHRYPLGTSYPDVCRSLREAMQQLPPMRDAPELIVDGTGVGIAVVDQMRELGLQPRAVTITGGFNESGTYQNKRVAKKILASLMDAVLSEHRLKVPSADPLAQVLTAELRAFTVRITSAGSEQFAALREKDHDDLVLAAALAVWAAEKRAQPARWVPGGIFTR